MLKKYAYLKDVKSYHRFVIYIFIMTFILLLSICLNKEDDIEIKINYSNSLDGDSWNGIIVDMGDGYLVDEMIKGNVGNLHVGYLNEISMHLPRKYNTFKGLVLKLQPCKYVYSIKNIDIYNHGILLYKCGPNEIVKYFDMKNIDRYSIEQAYIHIYTSGSDPLLQANDEFRNMYLDKIQGNKKWIRSLVLGMIVVFACIWFVDRNYVDILGKCKKVIRRLKQIYELIFGQNVKFINETFVNYCNIVLFVSLVLVVIMSICSPIYGHADEPVYRYAIDYYLGNLLPPRLDSNLAIGTFSGYGYSRLDEPTWYYFFAGKVAWIFKYFFNCSTYFRSFNVVLYFILIVFIRRKADKNIGLAASLCLSPQIWYLFSYANSDAWDLFWAYIAIYELVDERSALNRLLLDSKRFDICDLLSIGVVFGILLGSKANFYLILLCVFIDLAIRILSIHKIDSFLCTLKKCVFILIVAVCVFAVHSGFNAIVYGNDNQGAIAIQMQLKNVGDGIPEIAVGKHISVQEAGRQVQEIIPDVLKSTFTSSIGAYGWLEYRGNNLYNSTMFALQLLVVVSLFITLFREKSVIRKLIAITSIGLIMLAYVLVIYTCYVNDYQPQGRYVITIFPIIGYMICMCNKHNRKNITYICMILIGMLSIYSFVGVGILNMI